MAIDLKDYERGKKYPGDYAADLLAVQERLARIQVAHIVREKPAIIVFEGWDASGKGGAIARLVADWDPRWFQVWPIAAPSKDEKARHFLYRFWSRLPGNGEIAVFDRSWYGRVLVERVEGYCSKPEWKRGYDEINEFEAQQHQEGTSIVKLFMHVTQEEQDKRLRDRLESPWKRWKLAADDFRNRARRDDYLQAYAEMFKRTDTKVAPWTVIDGNTKKSARIVALTAIADALEGQADMTPLPPDAELVALAEKALGGPVREKTEDGDR